jgi:hypothetical protein
MYIEARSRNDYCCAKGISITYSECVFECLVIQHATRMRRFILSHVACLDLPYFSILAHKCYDLKKRLLNIKFPYIFSQKHFLFYERIHRDIIINVHRYSCKVSIILVRF